MLFDGTRYLIDLIVLIVHKFDVVKQFCGPSIGLKTVKYKVMLCKQIFLFFTYVQMYICLYVILTSTFLRDKYNQFKIRSILTSTLNYWKNDRAILTEQ